MPGIPLCGERVTLRTLPPPCGMNAFVAAAWVMFQVPWTLSSVTVRKPLALIVSAGARNCPPALLTSRSSRPCRSQHRRRRAPRRPPRRGCRRRRRSALPPKASIAARVSSIGSGRRPQPTTVAPSRPSSIAVSRPSPDPAPGDEADGTLEQSGREDLRRLRDHRRSLLAELVRTPSAAPGSDPATGSLRCPDEQAQGTGEAARSAAAGRRCNRNRGQGRAPARRFAAWRRRSSSRARAAASRRCGCSASGRRGRAGGWSRCPST